MTRRFKHNRDNGYPLPDRTVLYGRKKHLMPIPEVGRKYHCFDDGKITFSRHYIVAVKEVLGQMAFKRKYPGAFEVYLRRSKDCYWLYSRSTDVFVVTEAYDDGRNDKYNTEIFVRTKNGSWFSIGHLSSLYCGRLDVTGSLWKNLVSNIDDYDYTDEEKKNIIQRNMI